MLLFYTGMTRFGRRHPAAQQTGHRAATIPRCVDSLHRTKELGYRIKEALEAGDIERFGLLLHEHWENKKRRSGQISDRRIDQWYNIARENGALGGKIMGAGGGGFFMFCCVNGRKAQLRQALAAEGLREMPYDFDFEGAKVLVNF